MTSQDPFAALAKARETNKSRSKESATENPGVTDRHIPGAQARNPDEERQHISFHVPLWVLRAVDEFRVRSASITHSAPAPRAEILRALLEDAAQSLSTAEAFVRERRTTSERP